MKKNVVVCDKCGKVLNDEVDYIDNCNGISCSETIDLCKDCYKEFTDYVKRFFEPTEVIENSCKKSCKNCKTKQTQPFSKCICYTDDRCNGTKERDECGCDGNEFNCDFYDYVKIRAAEKYYNQLDPEYKCPYWSVVREKRPYGAQYEICSNSMHEREISCHGDKRLCIFTSIRDSVSDFANKVEEFIK